MTVNQLKYWELRWKQYYEFHYLKETKRSNLAREAETNRHNLATERISKQQLVLEKINLDQQQEKINQEWSKIKLSVRAQLVKEVIDWENLKISQRAQTLKEKQFELEEKRVSAEIDKIRAQINQIFSEIKVAEAEFAFSLYEKADKMDLNWFNANVNAFKNGWAEGAAGLGLNEMQTGGLNTEAIENFLKSSGFDDVDLPDLRKGVVDSVSDQVTNLKTNVGKFAKDAVETYGPDVINRYNTGKSISVNKNHDSSGNYDKVVPVQNPSNANFVESGNNNNSKEESRSAVIYSPSIEAGSVTTPTLN